MIFLICGNLNAINFKINTGAVLEHIYKMSLVIYKVNIPCIRLKKTSSRIHFILCILYYQDI